MDPISPPLPTTSAIGDDKSDLSCPKPKEVLECHICFDPPTNPVAGSCGHVFCWPCVYKWLRDKPMPCCPVCRHSFRIDRNIIPLYGGGVGAGPSNVNGNESSAAESPATSDTTIPPRPSNPLLVTGTASMEGSAHVRPTTGDFTRTIAVARRYMRLMREHSTALLTRVRNLETERSNSQRERSDLEHVIADLRHRVEEKDHRIFELERNRMRLVSMICNNGTSPSLGSRG
jgi:E3 ubiquitin-protein ligase RNF5